MTVQGKWLAGFGQLASFLVQLLQLFEAGFHDGRLIEGALAAGQGDLKLFDGRCQVAEPSIGFRQRLMLHGGLTGGGVGLSLKTIKVRVVGAFSEPVG